MYHGDDIATYFTFKKFHFHIRIPPYIKYTMVLRKLKLFFALVLPVFPEIVESQVGWRLVFPLVLDAGHDKHQDGYYIRRHGDELLYRRAEARYKDAADIETAEEEGTEDAKHRLPQGEDYDSDSQPASVAETVVGPSATGVVHYPVAPSPAAS